MHRHLIINLKFCLILTFTVIVLGAYTRLKDAGLGCPDWPGCYGHLVAPDISTGFNATAVSKAWIEMIHRYVAGTLGLLIVLLCWQALRIRNQLPNLWIWTSTLVCLVFFQAMLGMWTVTLKLNPLVVMGHLLGGIAILSTLWWIYLQFIKFPHVAIDLKFRLLIVVCISMLLVQIALGGWTSANYSALVCADFPTCQGQWLPTFDFKNAFAIPNQPLENAARVTIQVAHRVGALITTILCSILLVCLMQHNAKILKSLGLIIAALLGLQIFLGITNVLGGLPLPISLAHSAVASLLLLALLTILYITNVKHHHTT